MLGFTVHLKGGKHSAFVVRATIYNTHSEWADGCHHSVLFNHGLANIGVYGVCCPICPLLCHCWIMETLVVWLLSIMQPPHCFFCFFFQKQLFMFCTTSLLLWSNVKKVLLTLAKYSQYSTSFYYSSLDFWIWLVTSVCYTYQLPLVTSSLEVWNKDQPSQYCLNNSL